jgi:glucosamine 6-phosphate synthetase-like amidotransferase/phosphosugar isomerase protein
VASTKAFTAQVTVLTLMAFYMAQQKGTITQSKLISLLTELDNIPDKIQIALESNELDKRSMLLKLKIQGTVYSWVEEADSLWH